MLARAAALALLLSGCGPSTTPEAPAAPSHSTLASGAMPADTVRADWGVHFADAGARGTFVMMEAGRVSRYDAQRAAERFTPASTSKVFNALVFLDQGVVAGPDEPLAWDGVERRLAAWNRDQSLRSALEVSAIWYFQHAAREVGQSGYDDVFARQRYGNSVMGEPLDMAWLNGTLQISADEQLAFMDGLRRGTLGFSPEAQATVRSILPELASGDGWRLLAKTGWGIHDARPDIARQPGIGWLVGWVERPAARGGDVVFAMNAVAETDGSFDIGPGRLRIVRSILDAEGITR